MVREEDNELGERKSLKKKLPQLFKICYALKIKKKTFGTSMFLKRHITQRLRFQLYNRFVSYFLPPSRLTECDKPCYQCQPYRLIDVS